MNDLDTAIATFSVFKQEMHELEKLNSSLVFDYESPKGNKDARSHVYKLRQTKSAVEKARKEAKDSAIKFGRRVDEEAASIKLKLEQMMDVHLLPLKRIEEREEQRISTIKNKISEIKNLAESLFDVDSWGLHERIDKLQNTIIDDSFEEFKTQALEEKEATRLQLEKLLKEVSKREAEQAELERLRKEKEELQRKEEERLREAREAAIAKEAAERARKEAEENAKKAKEAAERRELELKLAAERAEREKIEAENRAREAEKIARENLIKEQQEEAKREEEKRKEALTKNKVSIVNLTPHAINLNSGKEILPSGQVARVSCSFKEASSVDGVPIYRTNYGNVTGLPEEEENTLLVVSMIVAAACHWRLDLIVPATGHPETVRNEKGQIQSVPGFTRL